MRKTILCALALALAPLAAHAQVSVGVTFPVPVISFQVAPRLVVVEPGIQVVPEYDEEVFFVSGVYWTRTEGRWYRARDHRGGWRAVPVRSVPPRLVRYKPGHYRHYRVVERERVIVRDRHDHDHDHHDHGRHRGRDRDDHRRHDDDHKHRGRHGGKHHDRD